jgi:hypothetical protein
MTTRRWMIVVVVAGLLMGGIVGGLRLKRRRDDFAARARMYALREALCREGEASAWDVYAALRAAIGEMEKAQRRQPIEATSLTAITRHAQMTRESAEREFQEAAYFRALARKYQHAARFPWLPVEPDLDPPRP